MFTKRYEKLASHMQKNLRDLVDRYFQDIVATTDTGDTSTVQNNNSNTAVSQTVE